MGLRTKDEFSRLVDLVSVESGFYFDDTNTDTLRSCARQRMKAVNTENWGDYLEYIDVHADGPAELRRLVASITVNETNFFRHPDQFKALKETVLPEIIERKLSLGTLAEPIASIWSAGCSTGDETYTIALQVRDVVEPFYANKVEILGTDIDETVLLRARDGSYNMRTLQYVKDRHLDVYFTKTATGARINDEVRRAVQFRYHNLVETPYPRATWGNWDVIFCRNVIIYFDEKTVKRVIKNLYGSLAEGGYLFLGYSESLNGIFDDLTLCRFGEVFAYRKNTVPVNRPESREPKPRQQDQVRRPGKREQLKEMARRALDNEKYDEVVEKATEILGKYPRDAEAYCLLARAHLEKDCREEAADAAVQAIEIDPLLPHPYFIMGQVCARQREHEAAIRYFRRSLYLDEKLVMAHVHLAMIYQRDRKESDRVREYKNAIRILETVDAESKPDFTGGVNVQSILDMCRKNIAK